MDTLTRHSLDILGGALDGWDPIAVACSFGKDSIVVLDLVRRIDPDVQVFSIVTRYKPQVTLAFKAYVSSLWNLKIKTYSSNTFDRILVFLLLKYLFILYIIP